jgi:hypothetical protein
VRALIEIWEKQAQLHESDLAGVLAKLRMAAASNRFIFG